MSSEILAAFRFFHTRTIYVSLPLTALLVFVALFALAGAAYGAGVIRGATYAGIVIALAVIFVLILLGTAGSFFFVRAYR
ncbi:MAG TPA: hypothetical protein VH475_11350 [Tepidisphaeraceae bacterium]